jgi:hypothetical protein
MTVARREHLAYARRAGTPDQSAHSPRIRRRRLRTGPTTLRRTESLIRFRCVAVQGRPVNGAPTARVAKATALDGVTRLG